MRANFRLSSFCHKRGGKGHRADETESHPIKHEIATVTKGGKILQTHKKGSRINSMLIQLGSADPSQNGAAPVLTDNVFPLATPSPLLWVALLKHVSPYRSLHSLSWTLALERCESMQLNQKQKQEQLQGISSRNVSERKKAEVDEGSLFHRLLSPEPKGTSSNRKKNNTNS